MMDVKSYESLRLVAQQQNRSPQDIASQLIEQAARQQTTQTGATQCWDQLSPRQKQIAAYVCRGDTIRQIPAQLHISETPVKSHVEIILRKFGINSRASLRQLLAPWDLTGYR